MIIFDPQRSAFLSGIDPRARVAAAVCAVVAVCAAGSGAALSACAAVAAVLAAGSGLGAGAMCRRLAGLNFFMLMLLVLLPLSYPGEEFFRVGFLSWSREGVMRALDIAARANIIITGCTALLASMETAHLAFALESLRLPRKLVQILYFMARYVEVVHHEYHRLRHAMKLRGFRARFDTHTLRSLGYLVGMLLVRGLDRSERVMAAMKCRGFTGEFHYLEHFRLRARDAVFAAATIAGTIAVILTGAL